MSEKTEDALNSYPAWRDFSHELHNLNWPNTLSDAKLARIASAALKYGEACATVAKNRAAADEGAGGFPARVHGMGAAYSPRGMDKRRGV